MKLTMTMPPLDFKHIYVIMARYRHNVEIILSKIGDKKAEKDNKCSNFTNWD